MRTRIESTNMTAPTTSARGGVHVMAKPIGPICNLDCAYCYYLEKEKLYPAGERFRMSDETLERFIASYIAAQPEGAPVDFAWQGGEPTLMGLDFFARVVELQAAHARPGQPVRNSIQTNGVLLDDDWCQFLRRHDFLVGLSIDGPASLHDKYRYDKRGQPTHGLVMRALKRLQDHQVEHNVLVVVNGANGDHGRRVYRFLVGHGVRFIQFIPIVERRDMRATPNSALPIVQAGDSVDDLVTERSVRPRQWGRFLIEVFDEWLERDVGRVYVQSFDEALAAWLGVEASLCVFRPECGRALAIEHDGGVYSCDHFVEPAYRLGNVRELPILDMAESPAQRAFGQHKSASLPRYCRECDVRHACHGECPKNRFIRTPDGEPGLNYLCAGYKDFFHHVGPVMREMAAELRAGRPAAAVMRRRAAAREKTRRGTVAGAVRAGRNDPCPCGSRKKFKHCCGAR